MGFQVSCYCLIENSSLKIAYVQWGCQGFDGGWKRRWHAGVGRLR